MLGADPHSCATRRLESRLNLEPMQAVAARQGLVVERREQSVTPREMLLQTLYFLWRRWKFVLAVSALALLAARVWLALQTPLYSASTQIIFDPTNEKLASGDGGSQSTIDSLTLDNQIAIVKSTALLRRVVEKENLVDDPEFGARPIQGSTWVGASGAYFERAAQAVRVYFAYFGRSAAGLAFERAAKSVDYYFGRGVRRGFWARP